jgi:hypothetical protein
VPTFSFLGRQGIRSGQLAATHSSKVAVPSKELPQLVSKIQSGEKVLNVLCAVRLRKRRVGVVLKLSMRTIQIVLVVKAVETGSALADEAVYLVK